QSGYDSFDFKTLYANGTIYSGGFTDHVFCCEDGGDVEVEWLNDSNGELIPWRCCPICGAKKIDPSQLQTWKINFPVLLERVSYALGLETPREEIPSVLYYMGTKWGSPIYYLRSIDPVWRRNVEKIIDKSTAVILLLRERQYYFYREVYHQPAIILENYDFTYHGNEIQVNQGVFEASIKSLALNQNDSQPKYRFVKKSGWYIKYDKTETFLSGNLEGLEYIQRLLKYPGQEIHVTDFLAEISGKTEIKAAFGNQEKVDTQTREEYKKRLLQIGEERNQALLDNDEALLDRLDQEVESIGTRLLETKEFCGKKATFGDDIKKIRRRISKKIKEALELIRENDQVLFTHLDNAIETGSILCYDPEDRLDWVFT
ncbi:MAG: hypothetical protein PHQ75_15515, partial [Thermoguttaceae bacterium]|nr:hypothetical protein [Thermoguttaceae bacterium]